MTAAIMPSNKIVSKELQDSQALLEPPYRRTQTNFWASPILLSTRMELGGEGTYAVHVDKVI